MKLAWKDKKISPPGRQVSQVESGTILISLKNFSACHGSHMDASEVTGDGRYLQKKLVKTLSRYQRGSQNPTKGCR